MGCPGLVTGCDALGVGSDFTRVVLLEEFVGLFIEPVVVRDGFFLRPNPDYMESHVFHSLGVGGAPLRFTSPPSPGVLNPIMFSGVSYAWLNLRGEMLS